MLQQLVNNKLQRFWRQWSWPNLWKYHAMHLQSRKTTKTSDSTIGFQATIYTWDLPNM